MSTSQSAERSIAFRRRLLDQAAASAPVSAPAPISSDSAADTRLSFSFFVFYATTFVLVGRPQDYIPALGALRPALALTILSIVTTILLRPESKIHPFRFAESKLYLGFFAAMVVGIPFSLHPSSSFEFVILGYSLSVVYFVLFVVHVNNVARLKQTLVVVLLSSVVFNVLGMVRGDFRGGRYEIAGSMFDPNDVAFVELSLLPFGLAVVLGSFRPFSKALALVSVTCGVLIALYTGSRGGLLGLVTFVVLFLLLRVRGVGKLGKMGMILVLAAIAAVNADKLNIERYGTLTELDSDYNSTLEQGRVAVWTRGLRAFADRPLTGVGVDRFQEAIGSMRRSDGLTPVWQAPHNSYIQVLTETGVLGTIPFVLLIGTCLRTLTRLRKRLPSSAERTLAVLPGLLLVGFIAQLLTATFLSQAYSMFFTLAFAVIAALRGIVDTSQESRAS